MAEIVRGKVFEHFLVFPADVRMVVINEMEPDDRCRFTRCSKLSQKEAQKCKKYIYGIRFDVYYQNQHRLTFSVIYHENHKNNHYGDYNVNFFSRFNGRKYIVYSNRYDVELWRSELDSSINIMDYACENVKYMLNLYQRTIKKLGLVGTGNYDFEIRSLSNVESLELRDNTDIRRIVSKIRKPLKEFECYPSISEVNIRDIEQIYNAENLLSVHGISMNYEQFQNLSAQRIFMNIGHLTEEDISDFIQSWQNDKLRKNFISCRWSIRRNRLDVPKLLRLLRINQDIDRTQRLTYIDISHNKNAAKKAKLCIGSLRLEFRVLIQ